MSIQADLWTIRQAVLALPITCRYHDMEFGKLGYEGPHGEPRCESCRPAWRRNCALSALDRADARLARPSVQRACKLVGDS